LLRKVPIFFIRGLGSRRVYQKEKKKGGIVIKKIGDDIIVQKAVTSFKQVTRHRMAFFKIKLTCPSDFLKNISHYVIMNFVPNFMFTHTFFFHFSLRYVLKLKFKTANKNASGVKKGTDITMVVFAGVQKMSYL
jgi:hypothetical protein